jgi:hypothetical protein
LWKRTVGRWLTNDHGVPIVDIETAGRKRKALVVKKKKN